MEVLVALCTCPDAQTAAVLARTLVNEHLAACVNAVPNVISTYRWDGEVREDAEVLLLIKTTRERFDALKARLPELHPYEVPELVALEAVDGLAGYMDWVRREVAAQ